MKNTHLNLYSLVSMSLLKNQVRVSENYEINYLNFNRMIERLYLTPTNKKKKLLRN
jgi:hypothetical protein